MLVLADHSLSRGLGNELFYCFSAILEREEQLN
jgi:hypothetical protein